MRYERIKPCMEMNEILTVMSEGHLGALTCLVKLINSNPKAFICLMHLDDLGIYGSEIYRIWNDCCNRDIEKFSETILYLENNKISKEKIFQNLNLPNPRSFV